MRINKTIYFVIFINIFFVGCIKNDNNEVYTIQGQLIDGTNPTNKFSYRKLKFLNEIDHQNVKILGETTTDENGNFKLSYEFSKNYVIKFMRIIIDTNLIAANKLKGIEIGLNWNKNFYLGDSAIFNVNIDTPLGINDTLYFSNRDSTYKIIGPKNVGYVKTFKCTNYNQIGYIGYGINRKYFSQEQSLTKYFPTGEPVVDELNLKLIN